MNNIIRDYIFIFGHISFIYFFLLDKFFKHLEL